MSDVRYSFRDMVGFWRAGSGLESKVVPCKDVMNRSFSQTERAWFRGGAASRGLETQVLQSRTKVRADLTLRNYGGPNFPFEP